MELTAKLIEEAEFRQSFRGYDVDQVDDFLEEVARGVEELQKQLDALEGGAAPAPAKAAEPAPAAPPVDVPVDPTPTIKRNEPDPKALEDNTDELRRTLILAQRTADAAIREAREEAARLLAEARDTSSRQIAEADAKAKKLVADAEAKAATIVAEAERQAEEHRTIHHEHLQGEITALEGTREQLRGDATLIDRHVEEQRQQLRAAVAQLQRLIDDPAGFRLNPPPPPRLIEHPEIVDPPSIGAPPTAASIAPAAVPDVAAEEDETAEDEVEAASTTPAAEPSEPEAPDTPAAQELTFDEVVAAAEPEITATAEPPAEAEPAAEAPTSGAEPVPTDTWSSLREDPVVDLTIPDPNDLSDPEVDDAPGDDGLGADADAAAPSPAAADADLDGEPTQAVPELKGDADEDAFLAELRKAMTDEEPLGPRDDAAVPTRPTVDPMADTPRSRPRFGRRR